MNAANVRLKNALSLHLGAQCSGAFCEYKETLSRLEPVSAGVSLVPQLVGVKLWPQAILRSPLLLFSLTLTA